VLGRQLQRVDDVVLAVDLDCVPAASLVEGVGRVELAAERIVTELTWEGRKLMC